MLRSELNQADRDRMICLLDWMIKLCRYKDDQKTLTVFEKNILNKKSVQFDIDKQEFYTLDDKNKSIRIELSYFPSIDVRNGEVLRCVCYLVGAVRYIQEKGGKQDQSVFEEFYKHLDTFLLKIERDEKSDCELYFDAKSFYGMQTKYNEMRFEGPKLMWINKFGFLSDDEVEVQRKKSEVDMLAAKFKAQSSQDKFTEELKSDFSVRLG